MQSVVVEAINILSDIMLVLGAEFGAKFSSLFPHLALFIRSDPSDDVRSALLGLTGRVRRLCEAVGVINAVLTALSVPQAVEGLGAGLKAALPMLKQFCLDSSAATAITLVAHNNCYAIGAIVQSENDPASPFVAEAVKVQDDFATLEMICLFAQQESSCLHPPGPRKVPDTQEWCGC